MQTPSSTAATLLFVVGTRPEAIKLAPVILLARSDPAFRVRICATGQHRELVDDVFRLFGLTPDVDLDVMTTDQHPSAVASRVIHALATVIERERPQCVVVQGDTVSTFASSLAAFYARVPVAHVEAGLRTYDPTAPWPEEMNRRLTTRLATLHFAPTELARQQLIRDGVDADAIELTGNTVIDAVKLMVERLDGRRCPSSDDGLRIVLVTAHRRENLGARIEAICGALMPIVESVPDASVVVLTHRNPGARKPFDDLACSATAHPRIRISDPLDYGSFIDLLRRCTVVMTDSGGIQEEAPLFGKPVLILRDVTERPELLDAGAGLLVGTDAETIARECVRLLNDPAHYAAMSRTASPFGDGRASERIVARLRIALVPATAATLPA